MAWEKRGNRTYFYRSVRRNGHVKKIYYGDGPMGSIAANFDALRRAERQAEVEKLRMHKDQLETALALAQEFYRLCDLLTSAAMLAAGFHRPSRHPWRKWRNGRQILNSCQ
jgi:hypothetical protein